jgi:hypothetical protein
MVVAIPSSSIKRMSPSLSIAARLAPDIRQKLAIEVLSKSTPVSDLATQHQVSRKFLHQQGNKAKKALTECFEPTTPEHEVLILSADHQKLADATDARADSHLPQFLSRCD